MIVVRFTGFSIEGIGDIDVDQRHFMFTDDTLTTVVHNIEMPERNSHFSEILRLIPRQREQEDGSRVELHYVRFDFKTRQVSFTTEKAWRKSGVIEEIKTKRPFKMTYTAYETPQRYSYSGKVDIKA